ncbi:putative P-loop ATPase/GTPase [Halorubrum alkaliphilum]|uniref:Putative P-loop ATPase/GTPase n=1 Tax=Halorubrum alkaliphilum TaxID=261290 RepID=A0A8T4GKH8_9EURY|nr:ATPase [Halorubrum alkaliphilum]MBP1923542.1 putative P-loop ATPase/GTPase [Halorubrum alkaliphilum]
MTGSRPTPNGPRPGRDPDPPVLLVAGGTRVDAGKTTFSTGLLAFLAESGENHEAAGTADTPADADTDVIGVKPRAGNDYWFDHDDVRISTDAGRLYGKDARRLAAASTRPLGPGRDAIAPEAINPVHRLWRPTPGRTGMLGDTDRTFLCDRVTTGDGSRFVVNAAAESEGLIPEGLAERLPLSDATRVDDVGVFNEVMADSYVPAFERLADRVGRASAPVVIESYADVAAPLSIGNDAPVDVDAVAVVDPGRARVYAGDRYAKARRVASGSAREGTLEEHTDTVTGMIEPLATVGLPALSGEERGRPGTVAERYAPAYEALLDAV